MKKTFVLASHGGMARGIYESVKLIMGEQENVKVICAYENGEDESISETVKEILESVPAGSDTIVLTDIYGGSINNEFMKYCVGKKIFLVSGMNLPLVIQMLTCQSLGAAELVRTSIAEAREGIRDCCQVNMTEEEDF